MLSGHPDRGWSCQEWLCPEQCPSVSGRTVFRCWSVAASGGNSGTPLQAAARRRSEKGSYLSTWAHWGRGVWREGATGARGLHTLPRHWPPSFLQGGCPILSSTWAKPNPKRTDLSSKRHCPHSRWGPTSSRKEQPIRDVCGGHNTGRAGKPLCLATLSPRFHSGFFL